MRQPTSFPSAHPVALDEVPGLDERLKASLHALDVSSLFGVQSAVWQHTGGGMRFARDLCVCAPTGSGKTLAYALPLVQGLAGQKTTTRLRALVVVPGPGGGGACTAGSCGISPALPVSFELPGATR